MKALREVVQALALTLRAYERLRTEPVPFVIAEALYAAAGKLAEAKGGLSFYAGRGAARADAGDPRAVGAPLAACAPRWRGSAMSAQGRPARRFCQPRGPEREARRIVR